MGKVGKGRGTVQNPLRPLYWMPVLAIVLCIAAAKLILWKKLSESSTEYIPQIIGCMVGLLGSYRGAKLAPRQGFLWGMINATAFGIMLMLGNLFFFGETFSGVGEMFLWILGGGFLGGILANIKKGKIA